MAVPASESVCVSLASAVAQEGGAGLATESLWGGGGAATVLVAGADSCSGEWLASNLFESARTRCDCPGGRKAS